MKKLFCKKLFGFLIIASMISCKKSDSPITKVTPVDLDSITANYYEQYLKLYPLDATAQGDERYNDQLPINIDKDFISGEITFYNSVQNQLKKVDYKSLSDQDKTVYDVLDYTLKDKIERYAYHPEYIPFTQFSGLPLDFPLLGSGQGNQPFKTEKDYSDWLKRTENFPAWMDAAIENFREGITNQYVLPKKLVVKMVTQMNAEEITSSDFSKNIFYGPINNFPKNFTAAQREKFTKEFKTMITKRIIPSYTKMGSFLQTEYLPKARTTDGINGLPKGNDIYAYFAKSWTTTTKTPAARSRRAKNIRRNTSTSKTRRSIRSATG